MSLDDRNYYNDRRVRAAEAPKWYESLDKATMTATVSIYDPSDEIAALDPDFDPKEHDNCTVKVPFKYGVCGTCEGKGKHVNPSIDANGLTAEDFAEDPDFREEYMTGRYDVTCYECGGQNVVPEIDEEHANKAVVKALEDAAESEADYARTCYYERLHGA